MAKLSNFIYCINAERIKNENGEESINAFNVLSAMRPEFVPGMFSFSIVFFIQGLDIKKSNKVQVIFTKKDDDCRLVDSGVVEIPPMPKKSTLPQEYSGLNITMDCRNVSFKSEGIYVTKI